MPLADLVIIACVTMLLPLLGWAAITRTRLIGIIVGAMLVLVPVGIVFGLARGLPLPGGTDMLFAYPLAALALIAIGRSIERRSFQATTPAATAKAAYIVLALHLAGLFCLCAPAMLLMVDSEELHTSPSVLSPLPDGLTIASDEGDDCGMAVCYRNITISSTRADSTEAIERRLRDHLVERGWNLGDDASDCRKLGWLIDQRVLCLSLRSTDAGVVVQLEGSRAWA
ncbi:hypothetical protein HDA40_005837 [Hamadaea flava]|uniref:Uncharacterized protein n=1 Tax=Hamadaea flava TaxID=1742688 RepID=A0ABV8LS49_9ACTN|nr:hypothetical protein [Hamadaea flava]MCP2327330.1 hypothetical protein [Hamadaea flava]